MRLAVAFIIKDILTKPWAGNSFRSQKKMSHGINDRDFYAMIFAPLQLCPWNPMLLNLGTVQSNYVHFKYNYFQISDCEKNDHRKWEAKH